jgi:hypothetical protein
MISSVSKGFWRAGLVVTALSFSPATAAAQSEGRFAIGGQVSFHFPVNNELDNSIGYGVTFRLTRPAKHDGWGPDFGFGWISSDLSGPLDGHINVRPILGGVAYRIVRGRIRTHFNVLTGPAWVKIKVEDQELERFSELVGVPVVGVDAKNTWVVKPGVKVTYDLFPRIGVFVGTDYAFARTTLQIRTATDTPERRVRADTYSIKTGFMVGIF